MTPKEYAEKLVSLFEYKLNEDSKQYGIIIVEEIMVSGYVKHVNGRKTKFAFDKKVFEPKEVEGILNGIGRIYK